MLSLRHLLIFQKVSETENFTKAAQELFITQSAVSHAIKALEEDTKTVLFDRLSKKVRLTSYGTLLLEEVMPLLSECKSLKKRMEHLEKKAPIKIVTGITIAGFWLPNIIKQFEKECEEVPIQVEVVSSYEAIQILQKGEADIALIEGIQPKGAFVCKTFGEYPMEIVCSPSYPLERDNLSVSEFCAEKLLLREKGSAIRETLDSNLSLHGHNVTPAWASVNSLALIQAAKAGIGITILPDVLLKDEIEAGRLKKIDVKDLCLKNELHVVYHKDKYVAAPLKSFLEIILGRQEEVTANAKVNDIRRNTLT